MLHINISDNVMCFMCFVTKHITFVVTNIFFLFCHYFGLVTYCRDNIVTKVLGEDVIIGFVTQKIIYCSEN